MAALTRQDLIWQKSNMKSYLELLSTLTGRSIAEKDLCSLEDVIAMRERSLASLPQPTASFDAAFVDLSSDRFAQFICRLKAANTAPVFVWTVQTIYCGALFLPSIDAVLELDFEAISQGEGVISFSTDQPKDRLLLDFDEIQSGQKMIAIETQGPNWLNVAY